jgi:hypothetical protein
VNIDPRLYVAIVPFEGPHAPVPHPVEHGRFDPDRIYKVIGTYNASETSEAYFTLVNDEGQIWYISNRHLRAAALLDDDAFSLSKSMIDPVPNKRFERLNGVA